MHTLTVLGLDPGTKNLGWAVLRGEQVIDAATLHTAPTQDPWSRHQWLTRELRTLVTTHQPALVAYEEFTWRANERIDVKHTAWIHRLIGTILCLGELAPYPQIVPLQPSMWGQQLTGHGVHTKAQVANAVNLRLGTTFSGGNGGHTSDAVAIALVAMDQARHAARMPQTTPRQR